MKSFARSLPVAALLVFLTSCTDAPKTEGEGKGAAGNTVDLSYFFGARIIPGDGSPALEDMSFIVNGGKFTTIGKRSEVVPPKGANRIELTGRTVTPVFINLQAQPGMNNGAVYGPKNYTRELLTADLSRYLYYGVMAVASAGTDDREISPFRSATSCAKARSKAHGCSRQEKESLQRGADPAGLSEVMIGVPNAIEAKRAVSDQAEQKVDLIKLWMDDGNGKGPKLKPEAYNAAIDEAHKHNLKVMAEVFDLSDAKDLVKAGVDGFVSSIRDREVDDALIAAMKEKNVFWRRHLTGAEAKFIYADKPDWLGEQTMREVY